jgi:outer membrane protein TolC
MVPPIFWLSTFALLTLMVGEGLSAAEAIDPLSPSSNSNSSKTNYTSSKAFELDYVVEGAEPSAVTEVQLWGTCDGGATWSLWGNDDDCVSPIKVLVDDENAFGFTILVSTNATTKPPPPAPGAMPAVCVVFDQSPPRVEDFYLDGTWLVWRVTDDNLGATGVSLSIAMDEGGPFANLAKSLPESGSFALNLSAAREREYWLQLESQDLAGNVTRFRQPVSKLQKLNSYAAGGNSSTVSHSKQSLMEGSSRSSQMLQGNFVSGTPASEGESEKLNASLITPDFHPPWWSNTVIQTSLTGRPARPLPVEELIARTLTNAARLRIASINPEIEQTRIGEAQSEFDLAQFVSTRWLDTDRPVGSTLDIGGTGTRLIEEDLQTDIGIKRKNSSGGRLELFERLQLRDSNSDFFVPANQGLTQLTMRFSQPLMRDRGVLVNTRQVVTAQYVAQAAAFAQRAEVADYVLRTVEVYWDLYRNRAEVAIQRRLYNSTVELLRRLEQRDKIDASSLMIVQAQTVALTREADLAAAEGELRRSQNELVRLIGDNSLDVDVELVPVEQPMFFPLQVNATTELTLAMEHRPEINESLQRIRRSQLAQDVGRNQLLPQLTLVLDSTLYGLSGDFNVAEAFGNQFSAGAPTYSVGLNLEYPWGNRSATAKLKRAQLEYSRDVSQMVDTVQKVKLEVKNALVDLETLQQQIDIRSRAVLQAAEELRRVERRRELFTASDRVASLVLQDLLDSQNRSAAVEREYAKVLAAQAVAILRLRRASGTLWREVAVVHAPTPTTGSTPMPNFNPMPEAPMEKRAEIAPNYRLNR